MRYHLLGLVLLAGAAAPSLAQNRPYIEPEIQPAQQTQTMGGIPASSALANLTARLDAMERQLATLTGQNEESAHRVRQLEQQLTQARSESDDRLRRLEAAGIAAVAEAEPVVPGPEEEPATRTIEGGIETPATGDAAEDAYLTGYRQWEAKQFGAAQKTLEAMAKKYPRHNRASYALNLAGRAYLDDGKPATAAKVLLSNYQTNPKGDRAADSLYFLGEALVALKKGPEACKVYDELTEVYPTMRDWVRQRLPEARAKAKCGS